MKRKIAGLSLVVPDGRAWIAWSLLLVLAAAAPALAAGPQIVISGGQVTEGDAGTAKARFGVDLLFDPQLITCQDDDPNCSARTVRVCLDYVTVAGTAMASPAADADFLSAADSVERTVTLSGEGEAPVASIEVDVVGDDRDETDETFTVRIAHSSHCPVSAGLAVSEAEATIVDDDGVVPAAAAELAINDVTIREGDEAGRTLAFTVSLSRPVTGIVSVSYRSADGTASAAPRLTGDYGPVQGAVTFTRFQTSRRIEVSVRGDANNEANETFTVQLVKATGATIVDGSGLGTIVDDD
jgi:chitinase